MDNNLVHTQCLWFVEHYLPLVKRYPDGNKPIPLDFSYAIVDHAHLKDIFKGFEIKHARFHHFNKDDFIAEHTDTAYEGYDTFICNLDANPDDSRLALHGQYVQENLGEWIRFDINTPHRITKGNSNRNTLVVWAKEIGD